MNNFITKVNITTEMKNNRKAEAWTWNPKPAATNSKLLTTPILKYQLVNYTLQIVGKFIHSPSQSFVRLISYKYRISNYPTVIEYLQSQHRVMEGCKENVSVPQLYQIQTINE